MQCALFYRYAFEKETTAQTAQEIARLNEEMKAAADHPYTKFPGVEISLCPLFSMHDQKITGALCNNPSMQKCPFCMATPTMIMNDEVHQFEIKKPEFLKFGLSPLHFRMRAFENICKMGFNRKVFKRNHQASLIFTLHYQSFA